MSEEDKDSELFGKTFDQQVKAADGNLEGRDTYPNHRIKGEVVFEPLRGGVRVTARDEEHRLLWGYIGSRPTLEMDHCLVAIYGKLQDVLRQQLKERGLPTGSEKDPIEDAQQALRRLEEVTADLKDSLDVKKVSDATRNRAEVIACVTADALKQIDLAKSMLKDTGNTD